MTGDDDGYLADVSRMKAELAEIDFNQLTPKQIEAHDRKARKTSVILDGRNRIRACLADGVEPRFVEFAGDDPIAFIISANIERRHLDESMRAMRAARLATLHFMAWRDPRTLRRGSAVEGTTRRAVCRKRQRRDARIVSSSLAGAARGGGRQSTSIDHMTKRLSRWKSNAEK